MGSAGGGIGGIAPERMNDVTLTMKSKMIRRFRDLAKELKTCLVFGLAERIGDDVYNCAVFLDQKWAASRQIPQNAAC